MDIIKSIEQESLRSDVPQFNVGDTVRSEERSCRERVYVLV